MYALVVLLLTMSVTTTSQSCGLKRFENLVSFGDSFTDTGRLGYFIENAGSSPPVGELAPESNVTASGGRTWVQFVAAETGARLYNYAVSGAVCSDNIVERFFDQINRPFPSVLDYQIPAFEADAAFESLYPTREPDNTVYALWIGTNDLGYGVFLSDSQIPGVTLPDFIGHVWEVFDRIYKKGGRHMVLINAVPLDRAPLYVPVEDGGYGNSNFWQNKTEYDTRQLQQKLKQYVVSVNTMFDYGVPFQLLVEKRWPGASFAILDAHSLFQDMYDQPAKYLDAPANVDGVYRECQPGDFDGCVDSEHPLSSFMWFDELHPSERTVKVVGEEFVRLVQGESTYGTHYRSNA